MDLDLYLQHALHTATLPSLIRRNLFECGEHNSSSYLSPVGFKPFALTQSLLFGLLPLFESGDSVF